ncbi:MAG: dipeptidase [Candidatus Bathyarchaeia archaeon]
MEFTSYIQRIHEEATVVDAHNDTIVAHMRLGLGLALRTDKLQLDLPRMKEGGLDVAFFAIDVTRALKSHLTYALDALGFFEAELNYCGDLIAPVLGVKDFIEIPRQGRIGAILAIENSDALEGSLNVLRVLFKLGIRSIGLTHNPRSLAADGVDEARTGGGLTNFGIRLIEEMNRLGILVDLAHVSERGFWEALEVSKKPVIVSHGNCKALCDHKRNITDEQIKGLAHKDGVLGLSFVPSFVDAKAPSLQRLLDHVDHVVKVAGIDFVGLGSDFDGGGTLLKDATELSEITKGLFKRGYKEEEVRKILGENFLRVLSRVLPGA